MNFLKQLDRRLALLNENVDQARWKDIYDKDYDRQIAENALYYTIGPLTDSPRWANDWTSPDGMVYRKGSPAPRWTDNEVAVAYAGDMRYLDKPGHPKSPAYGGLTGVGTKSGGSPLWRLAKQIAVHYNRKSDLDFIKELYGNGYMMMSRLMKPGHDESRSAFIPWITASVRGAMMHGVGGTDETRLVMGGRSARFQGLEALAAAKTGDEARKMANQVKGRYQTEKSHDKHPDNPFSGFSSRYYAVAIKYANALDSGDQAAIENAKNEIQKLREEAQEYNELIPGASTGAGQAISTPDRETSIGIASMDAPTDDKAGGMAGNIPETDRNSVQMSWVSPEAMSIVFETAVKHDLGKALGLNSKYVAPILQRFGVDDIGGPMTANELRYIIRYLGSYSGNYPGKGAVREARVPRDTNGWWKAGWDPELEPMPNQPVSEAMEDEDTPSNGEAIVDGVWHSIWLRRGSPVMGPVDIAKEMTDEYFELTKLGIPSGRKATQKVVKGKPVVEVVSKMAISTTTKKAMVKLAVAAELNKRSLGLDDVRTRQAANNVSSGDEMAEAVRALQLPIMEATSADRYLIVEACNFILRRCADMAREAMYW